MRFVLFCHSLLSDWNHGNAHFLRGVVTELARRGHRVTSYERRDAWSLVNLLQDRGTLPGAELARAYPDLDIVRYDDDLDLDQALDGADVVLVHEWNEHALVSRIGEHHRRDRSYTLLFHDTHHRSVTQPEAMRAYDLRHYDGVLAFGEAIRQVYLDNGWAENVWTWHEAADTRVFRPLGARAEALALGTTNTDRFEGDLVWVGNWGDDERTAELRTFLLEPVKRLGLRARVHGVRYPEGAKQELAAAGIDFAGFLHNHDVPRTFARFAATVHVPRRPYAEALPGIPTIRVFEALACGIPLVCAPWQDSEQLFRPGTDYLVARDGDDMQHQLSIVLNDPDRAVELARAGLETVRARHTCAHRVDELLAVVASFGASTSRVAAS